MAINEAIEAALSCGDIPTTGLTEDQAAAYSETFATEHIFLAMMVLRGPAMEALLPGERDRLECDMRAFVKEAAEQVVGEVRERGGGALPCDAAFLREVEERALSFMELLI